MSRKLLTAMTLLTVLIVAGCNDDPTVVKDRDPLADPLGDVAWLGGAVYGTNTDRSAHQGSQVDLMRFEDADTDPDGAFDLGLNGYGYLAMAAGPADLYLQARDLGYVFRVTATGEHVWLRQDAQLAGFWQARGLAYRDDTDRLVALYTRGGDQYRARTYTADLDSIAAPDVDFTWDVFDAATGPRALAFHAGSFYVLGADTTGNDVVVRADTDWTIQEVVTGIGTDVAGLTVDDAGQIVIAHTDRRRTILR